MAKKSRDKQPAGPATIVNRRATHDYEILDTVEAGLVLVGSEVKSLFLGRAALTDSYVKMKDGEAWILNFDIELYSHSTAFQPERRRDRKLLLHRKEIDKLERQVLEKSMALIPLKVYFNRGHAKCLIGIARGKKQYDKRHSIAEKEMKRDQERALQGRD